MRRRLIRVALAALAVGVSACGSSAASSSRTQTQTSAQSTTSSAEVVRSRASAAAAVASTNALAFDLLRSLGSPARNIVYSPYSIQAALTMACAGAAGQTAAQMNRVLHSGGAAALAASNASLSARLTAAVPRPSGVPPEDAPQLNIANGLWVQSGFSLKQSFTRMLASGFGAAPQSIDFRSQPDAARQSINSWVADHTAQIIKNLMPPSSITAETKLVLANAVYLRAHWTEPFVPADTAPGTFVTAADTRVRAPFMTQSPTYLQYAHTPLYSAIELPYLYSHLYMLVVMPAPGKLASLQRELTPKTLDLVGGSLHSRMVKLRMPRFHLAVHRSLDAVLQALGMPLAFSDRADFSGITAKLPLKIATVQHGADLAVDEQGTVAAAATGISIGPTAAAPSPVVRLTLDHPFLLLLRDRPTGAILFAGRVTDPTQS